MNMYTCSSCVPQVVKAGISRWRSQSHAGIRHLALPLILIVASTLGLCIGLLWYYTALRLADAAQPELLIEGSVFVSTHMTFVPTSMPGGGELEVIPLSPERLQNTAGRLPVHGMTGAPGSKITWPKSAFGDVPNGWRIEITNDSPSPLIEVAVPVRVKYGKQGNEREAVYSLVSVRLDPGAANRRILYLYNRSSEGGSIQFLSPASAQQVGTNERRHIRVSQPTNFINSLILLFPFFEAEN